MNATLIMAFILILIVVATVITKKLPFNFVLFIAPVLCALILGHSIEETSTFIVEQLASMMKSAGFMLLFAFLYFQMLTEAGVFDTIVSAITTKLGNKMNVIVIMVLTTLIGGFSILTGNFTPAYLITFPLMVPLYKKFDFDREAAFIIAQTAMSAMCFIPWGIGMAYTASSAGLDANKLAAASMPWGLCFIPAIIFQWVYFGIKHKRRVGTFQAVTTTVEAAAQQEENPNRRPKLFWVNFILFILCLVALGIFGIAPYFVFIFATVITAMLNYKDNFGEIFNKVGPMYLNILIMLLAINVYQAVFNNTGMVEALSNGLMQVCPSFLLRYLHVIMLLLCVVIIYVVPFQIFNALYPVFISIGAGFGIPAVAIIAPFAYDDQKKASEGKKDKSDNAVQAEIDAAKAAMLVKPNKFIVFLVMFYAFLCMAIMYGAQQYTKAFGLSVCGLSEIQAAGMTSIYTIGSICAVLFWAFMMAKLKWNPLKVVLIDSICTAVALAGVLFIHQVAIIYIAIAMLGFFAAGGALQTGLAVVQLFNPGPKGRNTGIYYTFMGAASYLIPVVAAQLTKSSGEASAVYSLMIMLLVFAILAILSSLYLVAQHKKIFGKSAL